MDSWRRFRRNRLALAAAVYLFVLGVIAIVGIFWTPYSMSRVGLLTPYAGPTLAHPLGADSLGRDILSRLMLGVQVSLIVGLGTQVLVIGVGVVIGLVAGYFRGIVDTLITLVINIFYGVPDLLVALVLVVLLGSRGLIPIIVAISATRWMDMARLVRGQALSIREREYVEAARASGARPHRILFGHIFPNALGPIIVQATFGIPTAILFEAFLSFLGLGWRRRHRRGDRWQPRGSSPSGWRPTSCWRRRSRCRSRCWRSTSSGTAFGTPSTPARSARRRLASPWRPRSSRSRTCRPTSSPTTAW